MHVSTLTAFLEDGTTREQAMEVPADASPQQRHDAFLDAMAALRLRAAPAEVARFRMTSWEPKPELDEPEA